MQQTPNYPQQGYPQQPQVVVAQGTVVQQPSEPEFVAQLCGCCEDWTSCNAIFCGGCCCGCNCAIGEAYALAFDDSCCTPCFISWLCGCFGMAYYRNKIQMKYGMQANYCTDCICMWCCSSCAISQLYREVHRREMKRIR